MAPQAKNDVEVISNEEPASQSPRKRIVWPLALLGAVALAAWMTVAPGAQPNHSSTTTPASPVSQTSRGQEPIKVRCPLYHDGHPTQRSCIALNC